MGKAFAWITNNCILRRFIYVAVFYPAFNMLIYSRLAEICT